MYIGGKFNAAVSSFDCVQLVCDQRCRVHLVKEVRLIQVEELQARTIFVEALKQLYLKNTQTLRNKTSGGE